MIPPDRGQPLRVLVAPWQAPEAVAAIEAAGGIVVDDVADADAITWLEPRDATALVAQLHPGIGWVQLPLAGVEHWLAAGYLDEGRAWTTASAGLAETVAEHVLALLLAACRRLPEAARARRWEDLHGKTLRGATVVLVGAGAIGRALIGQLAPLGAEVIAINRSGTPVPGARLTLPSERRAEAWPVADYVVVAAPATARTGRLIDAAVLDAMRPDAWLINISRGGLVDTDALVAALDAGTIAGAALDVTDPEPLPEGHPLWSQPRALITPHTGMPGGVLTAGLAAITGENVARLMSGRPLLGRVDLERGY